MVDGTQYLYRGTTRHWPGNNVHQTLKLTCTSTDPLVATLFAIECRNKGAAIILLVSRVAEIEDLIEPPNFFEDLECAVNVRLTPTEFVSYVEKEVEVDTAIAILAEMGFTELPMRIKDNSALQIELAYTWSRSERLSLAQIEEFNRRIWGVNP